MNKELKIGIFDSGLGGLTVVQALQESIKGVKLFYIADSKNAPYGEKTSEQILQYSLDITQHFITKHHIDALIVACNTATSAAIETLRQLYPNLIIIGTEPAIKPAIEQTKTGKIGVLATPSTLRGKKYQQLSLRLSKNKKVMLFEQACPGLVEHIENATLQSSQSIKLLERWLAPMRKEGVDTIVLGCTHYPLAKKSIIFVMQKEVLLLDSGMAIAQRLSVLMKNDGYQNGKKNTLKCYSTGGINKNMVKNLVSSNIETITL